MSKLTRECAASLGAALYLGNFAPVRFSSNLSRTTPSDKSVFNRSTLSPVEFLPEPSLSLIQLTNVACCLGGKEW